MIRIVFLACLTGGGAALPRPPHRSPLRTPPLLDVSPPSTDASSEADARDALFNAWCTDAGIRCPKAEVRTTPRSVAGRGVFATDRVSEGEVVISIPYRAAMTRDTGAMYFPVLAEELRKCRAEALRKSRRKRSRLRNFWNRRVHRNPDARRKLPSAGEVAQAELTAYALAALENGGGGGGDDDDEEGGAAEHPWSLWVSQWTRNDPFQRLVDDGSWRYDDVAIDRAVSEFQRMAPGIPEYTLRAALGIRLDEIERYRRMCGTSGNGRKSSIPASESLYSILTSRYIRFSDDSAVMLPLHDMINHSTEKPNLSFVFTEDGRFEFVARRFIDKDEELFLCYTEDDRGVLEENRATWRLVQWGIPPLEKDESCETISKKEE